VAMVRKHKEVSNFFSMIITLLNVVGGSATVERCFSAMKLVKTFLRNHLNDDSLSHDVICYVEKEEMKKVTNDLVVKYFMSLKSQMY
jgi:ribosomal protein L31E